MYTDIQIIHFKIYVHYFIRTFGKVGVGVLRLTSVTSLNDSCLILELPLTHQETSKTC